MTKDEIFKKLQTEVTIRGLSPGTYYTYKRAIDLFLNWADKPYLPDLELPEKASVSIGRYGRMRKAYLEEQRPGLYERLLLSGRLYEHLSEIDTCCTERMDRMVSQMADTEGITESLKAIDQMAWMQQITTS